MKRGEWVAMALVGGWIVSTLSGCVSLGEHRALKRKNNILAAEKQQVNQELMDARAHNDSLRAKLDSGQSVRLANEDLIATLRRENDLLEQSAGTAQAELERIASKASFDNVPILGAKLPEPLDTALREFADQHAGSVQYDAATGSVKWQGDVLFAAGSDVVNDAASGALREFAEIIKSPAADGFEVIVAGHTDTQPIKATRKKHPTNWHLSVHRAISVATVLQDSGFASNRTGVMGCGEFRPIDPSDTPEAWSRNRRVEIYLIRKGKIVPSATASGIWHIEGQAFAFLKLP